MYEIGGKGHEMPNQLVMIYPAGAMEQTEGVDVNGEIDPGRFEYARGSFTTICIWNLTDRRKIPM